jgi:hypothetical protein
MLSPGFCANLDWHARVVSHVDHDLIDAFGVHIDLNRAAAIFDSFKNRTPIVVTALRDAAFTMHAHGDTGDLGALL